MTTPHGVRAQCSPEMLAAMERPGDMAEMPPPGTVARRVLLGPERVEWIDWPAEDDPDDVPGELRMWCLVAAASLGVLIGLTTWLWG